jgi:hypothetical protein
VTRGADPVEAYLDDLRRRLGPVEADAERLVDEVEGHLRDVQDELTAAGATPAAAAEEAVRRLGPAAAVAAGFPRRGPGRAATAGRWVAVGLVVVGAGALLESLGGDPPGASRGARLAAGLAGLALAEAMVLRRRWPTPTAHTRRHLARALLVVAAAGGVAGVVLAEPACLSTAAAALAAAVAVAVTGLVARRHRRPAPAT